MCACAQPANFNALHYSRTSKPRARWANPLVVSGREGYFGEVECAHKRCVSLGACVLCLSRLSSRQSVASVSLESHVRGRNANPIRLRRFSEVSHLAASGGLPRLCIHQKSSVKKLQFYNVTQGACDEATMVHAIEGTFRLYLHVWGFSDCCDSLPEGPTYISEAPRPKIKDLASKIF